MTYYEWCALKPGDTVTLTDKAHETVPWLGTVGFNLPDYQLQGILSIPIDFYNGDHHVYPYTSVDLVAKVGGSPIVLDTTVDCEPGCHKDFIGQHTATCPWQKQNLDWILSYIILIMAPRVATQRR